MEHLRGYFQSSSSVEKREKDSRVSSNDIEVKQDDIVNILLMKDAQRGCEDCPILILQAHMDMTCQKLPGIYIAFENDLLEIEVYEETVSAR